MDKLTLPVWTLVQHSAYGYNENRVFENAVEERHLSLDSEVEKVKSSGGMLFDSYTEAADAAESENYPPEVTGITPRARGSFARKQIDGLRIYVPKAGG